MEIGRSGYVDLAPSVLWAQVRVYYEEVYDVPSNTSDLKITSIQVKSADHQGVAYYIDGAVKIGGTQVLTLNSAAGTALAEIQSRNVWYPITYAGGSAVTAELTGICHDSTGAGSVQIELTGNRFQRFAFYTADGGSGNGWGVKDSATVALTDIPRASAVAATDAAIGSVSTVTVTRRNAAYTYAVSFSFGQLFGWLDADGSILAEEKRLTAASIPFALPESFYTQLTDAPYGSCTLTCITYLGDTQIGDAQQAQFRVTADPALCAPLVAGTVTDVNEATVALTGDPAKLIRYASTALCAISAQARKGAAIVSKTIGGVAAEDSRTVEKVESPNVVFAATDSRGYTSAATVTAELIPYIPLTVHAAAKRLDPTGGEVLLSVKGSFYNGSFGAADNTLTLGYSAGEQSGALEAVIDGDTYTASATLSGLDYRSSHTVTVTAADRLTGLSAAAVVGKGIPVFDWGERDFAFHVPVAMEQGFTAGGKGLLDLVYPVGSVYMSRSDTDPATLFGGVWTPVENEWALYLWERTQ